MAWPLLDFPFLSGASWTSKRLSSKETHPAALHRHVLSVVSFSCILHVLSNWVGYKMVSELFAALPFFAVG